MFATLFKIRVLFNLHIKGLPFECLPTFQFNPSMNKHCKTKHNQQQYVTLSRSLGADYVLRRVTVSFCNDRGNYIYLQLVIQNNSYWLLYILHVEQIKFVPGKNNFETISSSILKICNSVILVRLICLCLLFFFPSYVFLFQFVTLYLHL